MYSRVVSNWRGEATVSIFSEDWRNCLSEQYRSVIRQGDGKTQISLANVLHELGFTEDDLARLRVEATMRAEDMPADFVPDLEILQQPAGGDQEAGNDFQPHPLECQCPACVEMNLIPHDEDGQPLPADEEPPTPEAEDEEDADHPKQLGLF
jgi:hypothetical protein